MFGLVDEIVRKEPGTVSNSKTVHQYNKKTLLERNVKGIQQEGEEQCSAEVAKQGLLALGRGNNKTHCSGSEKNSLPVVQVGIKSRKNRQTNMVGTKTITSKLMREVKK